MPDSDNPTFTPAYFSLDTVDEKPNSDDKFDTFEQAVQGIEPIKQEKAIIRSPSNIKKKKEKTYHRDQAVQDITQASDGLSTEAVDIVDSDQILNFAASGVQLKVINRLRKGYFSWEQGIDLHGFNIEDARNQLSTFIQSCYQQRCQVVLVVHGKAYSQSGSMPMLKSYTNDWLRQLPQVLAFSSAQAKDGGAGALYVLLKRKK